jgi:transcription elongation factor SPT4
MEQFEYDGCDNCESFLKMKKNKDRVIDCTSNNFDGMIAVMSPEDSWVCKWQRISMSNKIQLMNFPSLMHTILLL